MYVRVYFRGYDSICPPDLPPQPPAPSICVFDTKIHVPPVSYIHSSLSLSLSVSSPTPLQYNKFIDMSVCAIDPGDHIMCTCKTLIDPGHSTEVTVQEPGASAAQPTSEGLRYEDKNLYLWHHN